MTVTINMPEDGEDWLKLAGGVAAGIGTVAALPIFGPIGTVTALGAVLGGLAGAGTQLLDIEDDLGESESDNATPTPPEHTVDDRAVPICQNLFASARTAAEYDRAVNLLHRIGAWAAGKEGTSSLLLLTRMQLESLLGDGSASEFRQQNVAVYDNPPDSEQLQKHLQQAFSDGIDRDHFLAAALAMLVWLNQEIDLPAQDMPPL